MDKKEKLHDTWALADKPLLDKTKRTQRLSSDVNNKDSSHENSDQDSDSNDFLALPQEFRPNIKIHSQKQIRDTSINQTRKDQQIQNLASVKTTIKSLEKRTFHSSTNQDFSLKNKEENLSSNISSVPTMGPKNKIQYQILKQDHFHQIAEGKKFDETLKIASKVEKSLSLQKLVKDGDLIRQQRDFLLENEDKKRAFKYEHVQTSHMQTLHLNFNNLSFRDTYSTLTEGLNYETRLAQNMYTNHKKATQRGNRITKQNTKKRKSLSDKKFSVSPQQNIIRWDSALKLDEDKIEWTVIHEKTSLMVKSKITSPELNNELSSKKCYGNQAVMNYNNRTLDDSEQKKGKNPHYTKPKAIRQVNMVNKKCSSSSNFEFNNNLLSNIGNNLDHNQTVIYSDSTSDSDTWDSEQCICSKHQRGGTKKDVRNRLRRNLPSMSVLEGVETANHKKDATLTSNGNQNKSSKSQLTTENLKLPSHYGFHNLPSDATVESNIGNHKNYEQPLSVRNKKQNECSHLQEVGNSLNMSACHNFIHREEMSDAKDLKVIKESILKFGKEISDLIIASYTQLNMFISFYREWVTARKELIQHFEEVKQQLKESSTWFSRFNYILKITGAGAAVASAIPHPATSVAAKVATVVTTILQTFLNNKGDKSNIDNSNEMTTAIIKDNQASSDLYIWGLQCSQQFEETTKLIEEFHSSADIQEFFDRENPEITTFIQGFLEYKPNHQIFYKKLHKCFQELLQSSNTKLSKTFCEPFTLYPLPVDVIGHLRWRFRHADFNGSSVQYELEDIHRLIQNSSSISLTDLQKRIQTCLGILTNQLTFMENIVKDISIFDNSLDNRSVK